MKTSSVGNSVGMKQNWMLQCPHLTPPMSLEELNMVWSLWCHTAALIGVPGEPSRRVGGASGQFRSNIRSTFSAPPVSKCVVLCIPWVTTQKTSQYSPSQHFTTFLTAQAWRLKCKLSGKCQQPCSSLESQNDDREKKKKNLRKSTSSDNMLVLKGVKFIPC